MHIDEEKDMTALEAWIATIGISLLSTAVVIPPLMVEILIRVL